MNGNSMSCLIATFWTLINNNSHGFLTLTFFLMIILLNPKSFKMYVVMQSLQKFSSCYYHVLHSPTTGAHELKT